jgi:hypothetical protein
MFCTGYKCATTSEGQPNSSSLYRYLAHIGFIDRPIELRACRVGVGPTRANKRAEKKLPLPILNDVCRIAKSPERPCEVDPDVGVHGRHQRDFAFVPPAAAEMVNAPEITVKVWPPTVIEAVNE